MYWIRNDTPVAALGYLLLCSGWALGGWLLATHAFRLRSRERLGAGLALGMLLFISLGNLLARALPLPAAFWGSSGLILTGGIASAWHARRRSSPPPAWLKPGDLRAWPLLLILFGLTLLFADIQHGLSLFDDYLHLPLVSTMAAGDIPPHFYLNPDFYYAYHYALHVLAASLVRLADFFPWSGWDFSKAFALSLTVVLAWLWMRRLSGGILAASLGTLLAVFGGGSRWLMLLLPNSLQMRAQDALQMTNTGADTAPNLITALASPWVIEGGGNTPFPFAFHNGIFIPVIFQFGSSGALPYLTVLLLLLLLPRGGFTFAASILWTLLFANLALSAEHLFAFTWLGILIAVAISLIIHKRRGQPWPRPLLWQWGGILIASAVLAVIQGGFITETVRSLALSWLPAAAVENLAKSYHVFGFSLRWPPALLSAHLGELGIFNPTTLLVLMLELGPALLLAPVMIWYIRRHAGRRDWFPVGLVIGSFLSLLLPMILRYGVDRSITRFPATALWTWLIIGFPILARGYRYYSPPLRIGAVCAYVATLFGGLVIFAVQLTATPLNQYTYYIDDLDGYFARTYWNQLPEGAQVFDPVASRSVTLFGRIQRAHQGVYVPLADWDALVEDPDPVRIAQAGYDYLYLDEKWWDAMTPQQRGTFDHPCVDVLDDIDSPRSGYRLLIDIRACASR